MAQRINDFVIRGEICNRRRNSVSGWLEVLRREKHDGQETVEPTIVTLALTGNLGGELEGLTFRFEVRERDVPNPRPVLDPNFQMRQIGAMGDSVFRMVRVPLIPIEEFYLASKRGETPPEEQRASIYLEWYSQNGRVVLELLDPKIEFEGNYSDLKDPEPEPVPSPEDVGPPQITTVIRNDDGTFDVIPDQTEATEIDKDDDDDPFGLFPKDIEDQIRHSAYVVPDFSDDDAADDLPSTTAGTHDDLPWIDDQPMPSESPTTPRSWDEVIPGIDPETKAMYESWDEVTDGTKDEPLTWLFDGPLCLPSPNDVRDETHAWEVLRPLLTAMALRGVAFDMCPHFTAIRAYRLLIEDLLQDATVHPDLVATGFVQHFGSYDSCEECAAEFDDDTTKSNPDS